MKKHILISSAVAVLLAISGCGSSSDDNVNDTNNTGSIPTNLSAQLVDSNIINIDYKTQSQSGVTDNDGYFYFNSDDKNVTFSIGELEIATFDLENLKTDKKLVVGELFGLERNNTTDTKLVNLLRFLQSLDNDDNPNNGIEISNVIKDNINNQIDTNVSIHKNFIDNNLTVLSYIVENVHKKFLLERIARNHYKQTLESLNITPEFKPFSMVLDLSSNKTVSLTFSAYDYNCTIDWGDGNITTNVTTAPTHTYNDDKNTTVIKITGEFPYLQTDNIKNQIIGINSWGDIRWENFAKTFENCVELVEFNTTDTPDLTDVTDMSYMFYNAAKFNQPLDDWDVSNVTNMEYMFGMALEFNQSLNDWNVSNVTNMGHMFYNAIKFDQPLDKWDVGYVTNMYCMFNRATVFNQPLNNWNVSYVSDMGGMFAYDEKFNQPLDKWDVSNVTFMYRMFREAISFDQNISDWNVSKVSNYDEFATDTPIEGTSKMPKFGSND